MPWGLGLQQTTPIESAAFLKLQIAYKCIYQQWGASNLSEQTESQMSTQQWKYKSDYNMTLKQLQNIDDA